MPEVAVTVAESVNLFGGAPSNKWGDLNWNAFLWGEGNTNAAFGLGVGVSEAQASTNSLDVALGIIISDTQGWSSTLTGFQRLDQNGYYHVFPSDTVEGEASDIPTWGSQSITQPSWATVTVTTVTWS